MTEVRERFREVTLKVDLGGSCLPGRETARAARAARAVVPNLFGTRDRFRGREFFHGLGGWGNGFGMIQVHYTYCALYFYYYYIAIYNEIIIQLTIMQNQWDP